MEKTKVLDVKSDLFINELAKKLMTIKEIEMPRWAMFVKTSAGAERPPMQNDWWYKRVASILRKSYLKGIVGVSRLRRAYKRKKKIKVWPARPYLASGKIIRVIFQKLEDAGLMEKVEKPKKGRVLTKKGLELLEKTAGELAKTKEK
ncbi:MAG: 40S ribosomal protein S19 [Candidatus Pacearchaeota archaeon]